MRVVVAGVMVTVVILAGCLGGPASEDSGDGDGDDAAPVDAPSGCDPERSAIAHHAGGAIANASGRLPVPCFTRTGFVSAEPTMGITSSGAVYLYPATFTEVPTGAMGGAVTRDGGATWQQVFPNVAGVPTHRGTLDPYMHVDPRTDRIFFDDLYPAHCSYFSWSDDEATTWDHSESGCLQSDHQNIFTGPPATSMTLGYENVVYRCAVHSLIGPTSFASACQRSLDGGRTWLPPGEPVFLSPVPAEGSSEGFLTCEGGVGPGWVDVEGTLYVPKGWCGQPWLAMSDDEGLTWTRTQVATIGMSTDENGEVSHEASVVTDPEGNVYYAWIAEDRMPYLAISPDGGLTWGEPAMVGHPNITQASMLALTGGATGRVAISYMGSTNAPEGPWGAAECIAPTVCDGGPGFGAYRNTTWNGYLAMTVDALAANATWYTTNVNDPDEPLIVGSCRNRCQEVFDFIDVVIHPDGTPWASYVDGCSSELTGCESFDDDLGEGVAGWLWGGPSLWGPDDPNGPYP